MANGTIKVLLKTPEGLAKLLEPDATIQDGRDVVARWSKSDAKSREKGLVEWVVTNLESGGERTVTLSWQVEAPPGVNWSHFRHHLNDRKTCLK